MRKFVFFLVLAAILVLPGVMRAAACPAGQDACQAAIIAPCDCGTVTAVAGKWCWAAGNRAFDTQALCTTAMTAPPPVSEETPLPGGLSPCKMTHNVTKGCTAATPYGAGGVVTDCTKWDGTHAAQCESETCCLLDRIFTIADWIFVILLVMAAVLIIWGAFEFVLSGGVSEKVTSGRNKIIWALVGIVVAFLSQGLVRVITQIIAR